MLTSWLGSWLAGPHPPAPLPPQVVQVVCCRLTPLQHQLYCHFLESKAARKLLSGKASGRWGGRTFNPRPYTRTTQSP